MEDSGALPIDRLASAALAVTKVGGKNAGALNRLHSQFRNLPIPVIGRIADGALRFDLRCLEDDKNFVAQLTRWEQS